MYTLAEAAYNDMIGERGGRADEIPVYVKEIVGRSKRANLERVHARLDMLLQNGGNYSPIWTHC